MRATSTYALVGLGTLLAAGCASPALSSSKTPQDPDPRVSSIGETDVARAPSGALLGTDAERRWVARALLLIERKDPAIFAALRQGAEFRSTTKQSVTPLSTSLSRLFADDGKGRGAPRFDLARLRAEPTPPSATEEEEPSVLRFSTTFRAPSSPGTLRGAAVVVVAVTADTGQIAWLSTSRGDFE